MKKLISISFLLFCAPIFGQSRFQFFDGADTLQFQSIFMQIDSNSTWQIGRPSKIIFDTAATLPNAIITDTVNSYPNNDSSSFTFQFDNTLFLWGIAAIQWKQKLDFESGVDGGIVEYSVDSGLTWHNVMNDPFVYSFYGFNPINQDTLANNVYAFSGTDSSWADVWLCFDASWLSFQQSLFFRFSILSDSNDTQQEGWMIDNFINRLTVIHTLKEEEQKEYMSIHPSPTSGKVNIKMEKKSEMHIIKQINLFDNQGKLVKEWGLSPTKFTIDISEFPNGIYHLQVITNFESNTKTILLEH